MLAAAVLVYIVDDDPRVRESLSDLLASYDLPSHAFGSAAEYIAHSKPDVASCLVLDLRLPGMSGLELQDLIAKGDHPDIVFLTGHGDVPSSVRAMKTGAVDFLTKPVESSALIRAVHTALERNREKRSRAMHLAGLRQRFALLTPRELEVLPLVVGGLLNKQSAAALGISEVTLQIHRGHIMRKMGAGSLAELVRMAGSLEIPIPRLRH